MNTLLDNLNNKAWIVAANMGYGHQRAVYPLRDIAEDGIITVGFSEAVSKSEKKLWKRLLNAYEFFNLDVIALRKNPPNKLKCLLKIRFQI